MFLQKLTLDVVRAVQESFLSSNQSTEG